MFDGDGKVHRTVISARRILPKEQRCENCERETTREVNLGLKIFHRKSHKADARELIANIDKVISGRLLNHTERLSWKHKVNLREQSQVCFYECQAICYHFRGFCDCQ